MSIISYVIELKQKKKNKGSLQAFYIKVKNKSSNINGLNTQDAQMEKSKIK